MASLLNTIELESVGAARPLSHSGAAAVSRASSKASIDHHQPKHEDEDIAHHEVSLPAEPAKFLRKGPAILLISLICLISVTCSVTTGLITIAIPRMSADLALDQSLLYW